jgi:hypothetical protein
VALTVDNTFELMRGQLLSTGVVSLVAEDGDAHTVDFEVPSGQIITLDDPWNGAGAGEEFDDIEAAHEVFGNASGDSAGVILASRRAKRHLLNALKTKFGNQPIGQQGMDGYFADQGWPTIYTYDRTITNADGTRTRVFPEDAMVFLPAEDNPVGRTELGITQEAVQQVQRVQPSGTTALTR